MIGVIGPRRPRTDYGKAKTKLLEKEAEQRNFALASPFLLAFTIAVICCGLGPRTGRGKTPSTVRCKQRSGRL